MDCEARPQLHALVGYFCPVFGLLTEPKILPLEDAVDYARFGFCVLVDPQDERDLAMYERLQRACNVRPAKKWYE